MVRKMERMEKGSGGPEPITSDTEKDGPQGLSDHLIISKHPLFVQSKRRKFTYF